MRGCATRSRHMCARWAARSPRVFPRRLPVATAIANFLSRLSGISMSGSINTSAPARVWRDELIGTVKLAGPLALTQLGQIAMMTVDLALLGRLGNSAVAAAALAH